MMMKMMRRNMWTRCSRVLLYLVWILLRTNADDADVEGNRICEAEKDGTSLPTIFLGLTVRNADITLETHLSYLSQLEYPKDRIEVFIVLGSDSADRSEAIVRSWKIKNERTYANLRIVVQEMTEEVQDSLCAKLPHCWNWQRLRSVSDARQLSFDAALKSERDVYFYVDADVFLTEPSVLMDLVELKKPIAAPMILVHGNSYGSNFWSATDARGYYKRGASYLPVLRYQSRGEHLVSAVHSAVAVDLRDSRCRQHLAFRQQRKNSSSDDLVVVDDDDIVVFSSLARRHGIGQWVSNRKVYGVMMDPLASRRTRQDEREVFDILQRRYLSKRGGFSNEFFVNEILPVVYAYAESQGVALSSGSGYEPAFTVRDRQSRRTHDEAYEVLCDDAFPSSEPVALKPGGIEILRRDPQIVRYRDFLSDAEATELVRIALPMLKPSVVVNKTTGLVVPASYRTSTVAWLSPKDHPTVERIMRRIGEWTGLNMSQAEDLQVQRYAANGGEYMSHYDWSEVKLPGVWKDEVGNRIATLVLYLNEGYRGGATVFTGLNTKVVPRTGDAVFWYNLLPTGIGDYRTKHAGCRSFAGSDGEVKWIANVWIREGGNRNVYGLWGGQIAKTRGD